MSAPKLVEFEHGLSVYASSSIEARFLEEEFFRTDCYADISLPDRSLVVDAGALLDNVPVTGHAFCADAFINYETAAQRGLLRHGDRYIIAAAGLGATFSAMVFEH
jgi:hypothetical protein